MGRCHVCFCIGDEFPRRLRFPQGTHPCPQAAKQLNRLERPEEMPLARLFPRHVFFVIDQRNSWFFASAVPSVPGSEHHVFWDSLARSATVLRSSGILDHMGFHVGRHIHPPELPGVFHPWHIVAPEYFVELCWPMLAYKTSARIVVEHVNRGCDPCTCAVLFVFPAGGHVFEVLMDFITREPSPEASGSVCPARSDYCLGIPLNSTGLLKRYMLPI